MQIDKAPFPVHMLELNNPKVLIRPEQAGGAKGKHVVIGDPRPMNTSDKILAREVIKEKTDDGKDTLKIIVRNPRLGGQGSSPPENRSADQARPIRPVSPTGQTGSSTLSREKLQGARARPIGTTPIWSSAADCTSQTGLIRDRVKLLFQGSSIASRRRRRSRSLLLIRRSL